jgi:hypothetical protein
MIMFVTQFDGIFFPVFSLDDFFAWSFHFLKTRSPAVCNTVNCNFALHALTVLLVLTKFAASFFSYALSRLPRAGDGRETLRKERESGIKFI